MKITQLEFHLQNPMKTFQSGQGQTHELQESIQILVQELKDVRDHQEAYGSTEVSKSEYLTKIQLKYKSSQEAAKYSATK